VIHFDVSKFNPFSPPHLSELIMFEYDYYFLILLSLLLGALTPKF